MRAVCQFRAREITHPEIGLKQMAKIAERLADVAIVEKTASLDGRQMVMVMIPKPKKSTEGKKKDAENQNTQDGSEAVQDHGNGENHPAEEQQQPHVLPQEQEPAT